MSKFDWAAQQVLVTGGASFIGSHLVDALLDRGASVRVVDNLSSGKMSNLSHHKPFDVGYNTVDSDTLEPVKFVPPRSGHLAFLELDLRKQKNCKMAVEGIDIVFHLAAAHGGRGYVDTHQAMPASNLMLDGLLFDACRREGVDKVVYASSGCVYPNYKQMDTEEEFYLEEDDVGPPYDADNMYGWAKLMAEKTLEAYYEEWGLKSASCRYFTVYGPRGKEDHAVIAMIARSFINQDPFEVWGTGQQIRNWTYVSDIVEGTILSAEHIDDATAVNLGTEERIRVMDAVELILEKTGKNPSIKTLPDKPTGPLNRVCSNQLAKDLMGWEPQHTFEEGIEKTIEWYYNNNNPERVERHFERSLTER